MAWGNGAYVIHRNLEHHIDGYTVAGYHPNCTLFPLSLINVAPALSARMVHTTPDYAVFSRRKNIPLVITFHNYVLDRWMGQYSTLWQRLHYRTDLRLWTRMAIERANAITAVSQFTADIVKTDLGVQRFIHTIYNGVDEKMFTPRRTQKSGDTEIRVFFSGNLTERKGAGWLIAIADKLQPHVVIHYTQGLRTRRSLPQHSNLRPVGPVPFKQMPPRYQQMDILLMPTVREGLSLAVLEAMACGLPVVASNCSSLPEQIDEGLGGFLCPVGDVHMFADNLNYLADSPIIRKNMGQYNREKVERQFTLEAMVARYKRLFERIMV
jgi:glycosyltransferase involved in cell wall biosynthesis